MFSGGIEVEHWLKMGELNNLSCVGGKQKLKYQ